MNEDRFCGEIGETENENSDYRLRLSKMYHVNVIPAETI